MKKLHLQCLIVALATAFSMHASAQLSGYYQESFEADVFPPPGWQTVDVADPLNVWELSQFLPYSGDNSAHINYSGIDVVGEDWLILPQFSVAATDSFSFWMAADFIPFPPDTTWVMVSTTDTELSSFTTVVATLIEGVNYPTISDVYWYYSWSIAGFAGQNVYVAIRNKNIYGDGLYFDLVAIGNSVGAPCVTPTGGASANITSNSAIVSWNEVPGADAYKIRYKVKFTDEWAQVSSSTNYKKLKGLSPETKYVWSVKSVCSNEPGDYSEWSEKEKFTTSPQRLEENVAATSLEVYPNPFTTSTVISFSLDEDSHTLIEMFDVTGRKVQTVLDANLSSGNHTVNLNRSQLSAGTYFLKVHIGNDQMIVRKLMIQ